MNEPRRQNKNTKKNQKKSGITLSRWKTQSFILNRTPGLKEKLFDNAMLSTHGPFISAPALPHRWGAKTNRINELSSLTEK